MKVSYKPAVAADLRDIGRHIARDNIDRAATFVMELVEKCEMIAERPRIGRIRPELGDGVRSRAYRSYVIFYRVESNRVRILRIVHGARDVDRLTM